MSSVYTVPQACLREDMAAGDIAGEACMDVLKPRYATLSSMGYLNGYGMQWGLGFPFWAGSLFVIFMLWSLFWKGLALWHSAKRGEKWWFVALLIVNTAGILEIIYLLIVAKIKPSQLLDS